MTLQTICREIVRFAKSHKVEIRIQPEDNRGGFPSHTLAMTDLNAKVPGSGAGTAVMMRLGELCDASEVPVITWPATPRNADFYARFGFEWDKRRGGSTMIRYPQMSEDEEEEEYQALRERAGLNVGRLRR